MRKLCLVSVIAATSIAFSGCGKSADDQRAESDAQQLSTINAQAKAVDGDYDKLSNAGKQQILQMANGNEQQARKLLKLMAHPPNELSSNRATA
jgi:hypothetical protein